MDRRELFSIVGLPFLGKKENLAVIEKWHPNHVRWYHCRMIELKKGDIFRMNDSIFPMKVKDDAKYNLHGIAEVTIEKVDMNEDEFI